MLMHFIVIFFTDIILKRGYNAFRFKNVNLRSVQRNNLFSFFLERKLNSHFLKGNVNVHLSNEICCDLFLKLHE